VNIDEIRGYCAEIRRQGIKTVAISGIYSPIDREFRQEELVKAMVSAELPDVRVTISKEVANIGEFWLSLFHSPLTFELRTIGFDRLHWYSWCARFTIGSDMSLSRLVKSDPRNTTNSQASCNERTRQSSTLRYCISHRRLLPAFRRPRVL